MDKNGAGINKKLFMQLSVIIILMLILAPNLLAIPILNFSDIVSGPKSGNTDGSGGLNSSQHGAIVTVWGNYSGTSVKAFYQDSMGISHEAAHYYYEKMADGALPGGPADLYKFHKMREIAFSIPSNVADGLGRLYLVVDGQTSNTLPFTIRAGNIYYIKPTGNDSTGDGSWNKSWATISNVVSGNGKISAGDIVYVVGVNAVTDVNIGVNSALVGSLANPFSLIVYPNTKSNVTGSSISAFRNYNDGASKYWVFSKFTITTIYQAFSIFAYSRIIGNNVTGSNLPSSGIYSGWIGGNCVGHAEADNCSGHKILGNEVHHYGKPDGSTSKFHHLYYISNRSGHEATAYEIAWNYHHNNPVWNGIHIYDQKGEPGCGGWSGAFKIHHNVIMNQGGSAININNICNETTQVEVYDNVVITDIEYNVANQGEPRAAIRIDNGGTTVAKVYNNTVYGYGNEVGINIWDAGVEFKNNIIFDRRGVAYNQGAGIPIASNNVYYSDHTPSMALPVWDSGALNADPLFVNEPVDLSVQSISPAKNAGANLTNLMITINPPRGLIIKD